MGKIGVGVFVATQRIPLRSLHMLRGQGRELGQEMCRKGVWSANLWMEKMDGAVMGLVLCPRVQGYVPSGVAVDREHWVSASGIHRPAVDLTSIRAPSFFEHHVTSVKSNWAQPTLPIRPKCVALTSHMHYICSPNLPRRCSPSELCGPRPCAQPSWPLNGYPWSNDEPSCPISSLPTRRSSTRSSRRFRR